MAKRVPSYRHNKTSGRAVVTINGRDIYLGPYGSIESHEAYGRVIAQHSSGATVRAIASPTMGITIAEVVLAFMKHAEKHYRKDGEQTAEYASFQSALRPLVELYGMTEAWRRTRSEDEDIGFSAPKLRAVRDKMIELGWSRRYINKSVGRIRQVFKFAVSHDLVGPEVLEKLKTLEPLLEGRCDAVELPPRVAVPIEHIEAVRAKVNVRTRDMIDLCLLTGARPGELVSLTTAMIDATGDVWSATLADHKMRHKGKTRVLAFGPKAKLILKKYLRSNTSAKLFPVRRDSFSKTIVYWCTKLELPKFTGHWLRHNCATNIRELGDLDDAQAILGHSDQRTTQIYAHVKDTRALNVARQHG
ncbi:tyrosine-type recombinase/integrase [Schlesneria paludicola]|uniref:tyrosine-type recombinase/integrase n=1 Tax=Schlesneria paludicola TaxID=360056 RepID=UPI00029A4210|nr:tyrosine-type recombinase/integrase [Schlesneria paludicola]